MSNEFSQKIKLVEIEPELHAKCKIKAAEERTPLKIFINDLLKYALKHQSEALK